jgi:hypothetical protein
VESDGNGCHRKIGCVYRKIRSVSWCSVNVYSSLPHLLSTGTFGRSPASIELLVKILEPMVTISLNYAVTTLRTAISIQGRNNCPPPCSFNISLAPSPRGSSGNTSQDLSRFPFRALLVLGIKLGSFTDPSAALLGTPGVDILPKECTNSAGRIMPFWAIWEEFTSDSTRKKLLGRIQLCQE